MIDGALPADEEIRALAHTILARERYAQHRWDLGPMRLFDWLSDLAATQPALYWLLIATIAIVGVLALVHLIWSLRTALASAPPRVSSDADQATRPRWVEEAHRLAAAGRFLDAAHHLQLGVIDRLLRARLLDLSRSDPNSVLRQRLRKVALPEAQQRELLALIDRFERRWFRDRGEDAGLYESWRALHQQLDGVLGSA